MKKIISVLLAVLMLASFAGLFSASAALNVDSVEVSGYYPPRVGSKPDLSGLKVSEGFTLKEAVIEKHTSSTYVNAMNMTMTAGDQYRLMVRIEQLPTVTYASDIAKRATLNGFPIKEWDSNGYFGVVSESAQGLKTYLFRYEFKAEPAKIDRFEVTISEPQAGASSDSVTFTVSPKAFQQAVTGVTWYEDGVKKEGAFTFKAGKKYRVEFAFDVYTTSSTDYYAMMAATVYVINGQIADKKGYDAWKAADVGYFYEADWNTFAATFTLAAEEQPTQTEKPTDAEKPAASVCKWCGKDHSNGFIQKITGFFHKILAAIFGAKY